MKPSASSPPSPSPRMREWDQDRAADARVSSGTKSVADGRAVDLHRYRALFPQRWSAFLRAHFRDPVHAAYFFNVDEKTARNWFEGVTGPQGWAVARAIAAVPTARAWLEAA